MPSPPTKRGTSRVRVAPDPDEFELVFAELRAILVPYEATLGVTLNRPGEYRLDTRRPGPRKAPIMIDELARITRRGYEGWRGLGWVD